MRVTVNGEAREVPDRVSLQALVEPPKAVPGHARGIALALNGNVVRATDWAGVVLAEGDAVEVVTARQGG